MQLQLCCDFNERQLAEAARDSKTRISISEFELAAGSGRADRGQSCKQLQLWAAIASRARNCTLQTVAKTWRAPKVGRRRSRSDLRALSRRRRRRRRSWRAFCCVRASAQQRRRRRHISTLPKRLFRATRKVQQTRAASVGAPNEILLAPNVIKRNFIKLSQCEN